MAGGSARQSNRRQQYARSVAEGDGAALVLPSRLTGSVSAVAAGATRAAIASSCAIAWTEKKDKRKGINASWGWGILSGRITRACP